MRRGLRRELAAEILVNEGKHETETTDYGIKVWISVPRSASTLLREVVLCGSGVAHRLSTSTTYNSARELDMSTLPNTYNTKTRGPGLLETKSPPNIAKLGPARLG